MNLKKSIVLLAIIAFFLSCRERDKMEIVESASAFDLTQAKAAIKQSTLNITKAFEHKDTAAIVNAYTKNANVLAVGHSPLETDSIQFFLNRLLNSNVEAIDITSDGVWGDSLLLAQEGTYVLSGSNKAKLDKGKYIVLWKRESGNWKIYRQMWTSDLPNNKIEFKEPKSAPARKK